MNLKNLLWLLALLSLGACTTLPSSGPTGGRIERTVLDSEESGLDIQIVSVEDVTSIPAMTAPVEWQLPDLDTQPTDMIGAGDILSITIFEAGVALFAGNTPSPFAAPGGFDPSVKAQTLPPRRVDDDGYIDVPYAGRLFVKGRTIVEVQDQVRVSLKELSQDPQVLVTQERIVANSVIISGEVARPGRLVLETNQETLADIIALSGGYRGQPINLVLTVQRGNSVAKMRLGDVMNGPHRNLRAFPGDRLTIVPEPLMFSILGASGRVQQMAFTRENMTVVEAIAMAGGPQENAGDPKAIFLFRYAGPGETEPTVYHFNLLNAPTFFLAQKFALRDSDILYFGTAASNQPRKVIQTVGQLFAPIVTVTAAANNLNTGN
ncbi:MAG: polysaccharide biosynthesis/export family protein [Pseudomonadota bacterium]